MLEPAEQPTIDEILSDYGIADLLGEREYANLMAELENRDNVMRTDAAKHEAKKIFMAALDKIIKEV